MFKALSEASDKFWKCLRLLGYPVGVLFPLFREVKYTEITELSGSLAKAKPEEIAWYCSKSTLLHIYVNSFLEAGQTIRANSISPKYNNTQQHVLRRFL